MRRRGNPDTVIGAREVHARALAASEARGEDAHGYARDAGTPLGALLQPGNGALSRNKGGPRPAERLLPAHARQYRAQHLIRGARRSSGEGGSIRCPAPGWRFTREGECDDIPYSSRATPKAACIRSHKWSSVPAPYGCGRTWKASNRSTNSSNPASGTARTRDGCAGTAPSTRSQSGTASSTTRVHARTSSSAEWMVSTSPASAARRHR